MTHKSRGKAAGRARRRARIRRRISGTAARPRLSVFRSARHIYAQVIDDLSGQTLASASTMAKGAGNDGKKAERAESVGRRLAEACRARDIAAVVFDRNGFQYHGRVRAIAEAARAGGLKF